MPEAEDDMVSNSQQPNTLLPKDVEGGLMGMLPLGKTECLEFWKGGYFKTVTPFPHCPAYL